MLKISTEFRKGVLFIRLVGRIDNESYLEDINNLIDFLGIQYLVLNISSLNVVSLDNINNIVYYHKDILKKKKQLLICDKTTRNRLFKNNIPNISNELEAFSLIEKKGI